MTQTAWQLFHRLHLNQPPEIKIFYCKIDALLRLSLHHSKKYHKYAKEKNKIFTKDDFSIAFLSSDEMARLNNFKSLKKQIEWLSGRFLLKHAVCLFTGETVDPAGIKVSYRREGAPFLPGLPWIDVSLSHCREYVTAALCCNPDCGIGIDMEKFNYNLDDAFLKTAFTVEERKSMAGTPEEIFTKWTIKEAFLKYIKRGFNERLHSVEVFCDNIRYRGRQSDATFYWKKLDREYIVSLVTGPAVGTGS